MRQRFKTLSGQTEKDNVAIRAVGLDMHNHYRMNVAQLQSLEFKVMELLHAARLDVDNVQDQITKLSPRNNEKQLERLMKNLENLRSVHSKFMTSTNHELANLQTSHRQAARLLASLNRLGLKFGRLDPSRRINWLVDCADMINKLDLEDTFGCLPVRMQTVGLQSPSVNVMVEGGDEAEVFLTITINSQRIVCMHIFVIARAYPIYLEGSKLTILKRTHTFKSHDHVASRTGPCSKSFLRHTK